jgi:hypothetical protein
MAVNGGRIPKTKAEVAAIWAAMESIPY